MGIDIHGIVAAFKALQEEICTGLEGADGKAVFEEDFWYRPGGGGGRTRVIRNGNVFEKGGVNFSHVNGLLPDKIARKLKLPLGIDFDATGVSIVLHPGSPKVPIIHMNVRYFQMDNGVWWFGGGIDLTPIYIVQEDAIAFHRTLKSTCDRFDAGHYPRFKVWCDEYFYIPHRKETRGVGGIFFDHLKGKNPEERKHLFDFVLAVGKTFLPAYLPIVERYKQQPFTEKEKAFQMLRRSRYVEFNLVYDKGTKFGLDTDGRIESILMSMPPETGWVYNYQPEPGSPEETTLHLLQPQDWLELSPSRS